MSAAQEKEEQQSMTLRGERSTRCLTFYFVRHLSSAEQTQRDLNRASRHHVPASIRGNGIAFKRECTRLQAYGSLSFGIARGLPFEGTQDPI